LEKQRVALHRETNSMWAEYSADGILQNVEVYVVDSDQHAYFIPGKGWFENEYDETPVDAPDGFENVTEESLKALLPTDIGCEHQWSDPLCDVTSICSKCLRNKGEVLGHTWTSHKEYDICSTCNGILYHSPEAAMPSFNGRPELTLKKLGISIDKIAEKFPEKIITKYENGIFMVPNIDEYYFMARKNSGVYIYTHATNGWNRFEIEEEEVAQLQLRFDGGEDIGGKGYEYTLYYNSEGSLVSVRLESEDPQRKIRIYFEENRVEVTYTNADNNTVEYIDTYLNGNLTSQTVYDNEERIDVYYDSDLKVEKVGAYIDNKTLYYVPNMGWFADRECTKGIATPQGYEEKDAEYFREAYPSNIDFCIHEWNTVHGREECIKCGEKAPLWENKIFKGVIIGVVAAVIAAGAAFITVKRKRAVKK